MRQKKEGQEDEDTSKRWNKIVGKCKTSTELSQNFITETQ